MFSQASQRDLPSVLLIDDDLVSREVTATLLTMTGYSVHTSEGGSAAIELLQSRAVQPGVILMDAQMPGLSGTDLIAALRLQTKARIYVISGSGPPPEIAKAADGFLAKPFDADSLHELLDGRPAPNRESLLDSNQPVVNVEILSQLRKLMPEPAVRQIYAAVVADLNGRIEALGIAIAKGDTTEVRRIGHAIKGGCGMAGALQAAYLGAILESVPTSMKDNQLDNSAAVLSELRLAAQGLQRMLDAELPV